MVPEPLVDARAHRVLAGASRVRVLEFLRAQQQPVTAPAVAERVGLHPNTVRLHLDQLVAAGLVERRAERRATPGRPRLVFAAAPVPAAASDGGSAEGYQALAGILAGQLAGRGADAAAEATAAGRAWARALPAELRAPVAATREQATDELVRLMDRLGFAASAGAPEAPIELHHCPFADVAAAHPDVVCGVHLGLLEAVLDDLRAPVHAARLEPFAAPGICRAHLAPGPRDPSRSAALAVPITPPAPPTPPTPPTQSTATERAQP